MIPSDTPEHVKEIQLKIWLSKTPYERLRIYMEDNDAMMRLWSNAKIKREEKTGHVGLRNT